jgi:hypothetical protein
MDPIQMNICYPGAGSVPAAFLGAAGNVIRLAMNGWADAAEFRLVGGEWLSDSNELVEIDSQPEPWWNESPAGIPYPLPRDSPVPAAPVWVN